VKNVSLLIVGNFLSQTLKTRSVCEDLADQLKNSGWPVITTSNKQPRVSRLWDMLSTIWKRRHDFELAQVDVYSGPAFRWAEACCWLLRRVGKPYILTLHGGNLPEFSRKNTKRVQKLLNSAAMVTSPSPYLAELMSQYRKDLVLLPNPIDLKALPFNLRTNPRTTLIWLRAFHSIYNPVLAIKVLASLIQEFPDVRLKMGGPDKDGTTLKQFQSAAVELKVTDRVQIVGAIPHEKVGDFLSEGDIFLNTTFFDNTPVSVLEAMACGLCVVSTNVGGIPILIKNEQEALLVPPDDVNAMTQAVRRLLREPQLASQISSGGRTKVEAFDWTEILPKWQSLFLNVCQRNSNQAGWEVTNAIVK
jgi:glycosyltransferase involved in cell wall biosynthesis